MLAASQTCDSSGDSNGTGRGPPYLIVHVRLSQVTDAPGRSETERPELTNEGSTMVGRPVGSGQG